MQEAAERAFQKRQTAYKVAIKDIVNGKYIKEEGWQPNYVLIDERLHLSRANLICFVVSKKEDGMFESIIIDDGTGKLSVRVFDNPAFFQEVDVGDLVMIIGKPREFGNEKYLVAEIIKKIEDKRWIDVRKLELKRHFSYESNPLQQNAKMEEQPQISSAERLCLLLQKLDKGEGVSTDDLIRKSEIANTEEILKTLLEQGDIFEIMPGKLKPL